MKAFKNIVALMCRRLDEAAGLCMVFVMLLVVTNVILRVVFKQPVLGVYEFVGFITALLIALALANCALMGNHIAVGFFMDRLPERMQSFIDIVISCTSFCFWGMVSWHMVKLARGIAASGEVSLTTQTPFYVFIYLIAFGFSVLCLVIAVRLADYWKKAEFNK